MPCNARQAAKAIPLMLLVIGLTSFVLRPSRAYENAPSNAVEALQQQINNGAVTLPFANDGHGYLPGLLTALQIPRASQLLVFSASSLQFDRISPKTPRAIYHQDGTAIGTVLDGKLIEIMVADRDSGVAFYSMDTEHVDKPHFDRRTSECIICHGFASRWAPGMMVANMDAGPDGKLINLDPSSLFRLTDDRTPFEQRYGGWYVTGQTGDMHHRGNVTLDPSGPLTVPIGGLNLASVSSRIEAKRYLETGSDIVSLLTLEHVSGFVNLVTRINAQYHGLNNPTVKTELRATQVDIDYSVNELARYMTFADEVRLPSPVIGSSVFAKEFEARGPYDASSRSLRQFELKSHLFRYPLSYMIYSQTFNTMNPTAKEKLWQILYDMLATRGRAGVAAINIVAATKNDRPAFWKPLLERTSSDSTGDP